MQISYLNNFSSGLPVPQDGNTYYTIASDVHLGPDKDKKQDKHFIHFCKSIIEFKNKLPANSNLVPVFNGDIFDFLTDEWIKNNIMPFSSNRQEVERILNVILDKIIRSHRKCFLALSAIKNKVILIGNHDRFLLEFKSLQDKLHRYIGDFSLGVNYQDDNVYIQHGHQGDSTPIEVEDASAIDLDFGFEYELKQKLFAKGYSKKQIHKILNHFDRLDRVYPKFFIPNYIERQAKDLSKEVRELVFQSWNECWNDYEKEDCVKKFLHHNPVMWFFVATKATRLGNPWSRFVRFIGQFLINHGLYPVDPGAKIANRELKNLADKVPQNVIAIGHFHESSKVEIQKKGKRKILIRSGLWENWIRAIKHPKSSYVTDYYNHTLPYYSYIFVAVNNKSGLVQASILSS